MGIKVSSIYSKEEKRRSNFVFTKMNGNEKKKGQFIVKETIQYLTLS